tara:strand:- start:895 stop:1521 length:627 start_codon:yes stop_codon:yes gene_type:complete
MVINRKGCEICGVAKEEDAIGKTDHDFFGLEKADKYRADDLVVMKSGKPILNRIEAAANQVGSKRLMISDKVPIRDRQGRVMGLAGIGRLVERLSGRSGNVDQFANMVDYIQNNYGDSITTPKLAKMSGMSLSQFERRFKRAFGLSAHQYILRLRVSGAARFLTKTELTISEIALECGFYDQAHFCRSFRKIMNLTPSAFRAREKGIS